MSQVEHSKRRTKPKIEPEHKKVSISKSIMFSAVSRILRLPRRAVWLAVSFDRGMAEQKAANLVNPSLCSSGTARIKARREERRAGAKKALEQEEQKKSCRRRTYRSLERQCKSPS